MLTVATVLDIVLLAGLFVAVAREEITREQTATDEMWNRSIAFYQKRNPAGCDEPTGREIDAGNAPRQSEYIRATRQEQWERR